MAKGAALPLNGKSSGGGSWQNKRMFLIPRHRLYSPPTAGAVPPSLCFAFLCFCCGWLHHIPRTLDDAHTFVFIDFVVVACADRENPLWVWVGGA